MADYRLYILGPDGHIRRAIEIVADDDAEAISFARDSLTGETGELWNLGRMVGTFRPEQPRARRSSDSSGPDASAT